MPWILALVLVASTPTALPAPEDAAAVLAAGDSASFRARMLSWSPPAIAAAPAGAAFPRPSIAIGSARLTSRFGARSDPFGHGVRVHDGIDIAAAYGAPVRATADGVVDRAGAASGYGELIEIAHPGAMRTRYGHLSRILVTPGERIAAGQVIGLIGSTGRSTGPHLHYELRVAGRPVDPLAAGPVDILASTAAPAAVRPRWRGWVQTDELLPISTF